jgi:hypothetical protein
MKTPITTAWSRLTTAARLAPRDEGDLTVPPGFATRVAALAFAQPPALTSLYELFSWRALGTAALLALACVATNLGPVLQTPEYDAPLTINSDPVAEVISLT